MGIFRSILLRRALRLLLRLALFYLEREFGSGPHRSGLTTVEPGVEDMAEGLRRECRQMIQDLGD